MSQRRATYKIRLRVDDIEAEYGEREWSQGRFCEEVGLSPRRWQQIVKETRAGGFPNVGTDLIAGIMTALGWTIHDVQEQVVDKAK